MSEQEVGVRAAVPHDAEGIARVHVQAWREAYVGIVPQAVLDRRDQDVSVERWRSIIESGESTVRVAVRDGEVVGWATSGPSRDDDAATALELYGIYSLKDVYGSGVGQRLLEAVAGNIEPATLWVLEANGRARRFYERNGFVPDGTRKILDIGGEQIPEIRMLRSANDREAPTGAEGKISATDRARSAEAFRDLADPDVIEGAWR